MPPRQKEDMPVGWIYPDGNFVKTPYHEPYANKELGMTSIEAMLKGFLLACGEKFDNCVYAVYGLTPEQKRTLEAYKYVIVNPT